MSDVAPPEAPLRPERAGAWAPGLRRAGAFAAWVLTGFGLLPLLWRGHSPHAKTQEMVVYTVHRAFFLWALIAAGFVGAAVVHHYPSSAGFLGWVYVWVMLYTFVTLLFDVGTARFFLWAGIFGFVWVVSKYFEELKNVPVLSPVLGHLRQLHPRLEPGFVTVMSWLLLGPWVGALVHSFTNGRKRFTPNEIGEWFLGDGSELTDRSGLKFRTRYRDLLETFLGLGSGDLLAVDGSGTVVKRWENVLFLYFIWKKLDEVLDQRSAVVDSAPETRLGDAATR
jgi:hypothetical protein